MKPFQKDTNSQKGFTLIELLITVAISSVVMVAIYQTFNSQQKGYIIQEEVATMQQSARASMLMLTNDIRMTGYDKLRTGNFGIVNICSRDTDDTLGAGNIRGVVDDTFSANSSIVITIDYNENGVVDSDEQIQYQVYDFDASDTHLDLARQIGASSNRLLSENVVKFGLAFAFDQDLDGNLDTYMATNAGTDPTVPRIIWAIDSDGDNLLDRNLDTNLDGDITFADGPGGLTDTNIVGLPLTNAAGVTIPNVLVGEIRAVRVWLLLETDQPDASFNGTNVYVVGKYIVAQSGNRRMRLLEATVKCRN